MHTPHYTHWHFVKKRTADPAGGAVYVNDDRTRYRRTGGPGTRSGGRLPAPARRARLPGPARPGGRHHRRRPLLRRGGVAGRAVAARHGPGKPGRHTRPVRHGGRPGRRGRRPAAAGPGRARGPRRPAGAAAWVREAGWTDNVFAREPRPRQPPGARGAGPGDGPARPAFRWCADTSTTACPTSCRSASSTGSTTAWCRSATTPPWPWRSSRSRAAPRATWPAPSSGAATWRRWTRWPDATTGQPLSQNLGAYLLVKALFFLALMQPTDPSRTDKHLKWQYRRHLFTEGLEQYERTGAVDTALFPTLDDFAARHGAGGHP